MSKQHPYIGEVISLSVMLLMVVALVAAQADTSVRSGEAPGERPPVALVVDSTDAGPAARLRAVIDLAALTIAVDVSATAAPDRSLVSGN